MKLLVTACSLCLAISSSVLAECTNCVGPTETMGAATTQPSQPVNTKCPVSGKDIDARVTTQYDGKTVAFCCKNCVATFKKDPDKYMKDLK